MKFRKIPVVIEAVQYHKGHDLMQQAIPLWLYEAIKSGNVFESEGDLFINTLENNKSTGAHCVTDGDWIIKGVKGELYACKPDIFQMTYEPAE